MRSTHTDDAVPFRIVVMGVSGCGKSSISNALAARFNARFVEADEFHPGASIDKMTVGIALTDDDRWPWLARLERELERDERVVMACSALRRSYRDILRRAKHVRFVFLDVSYAEAFRRVTSRTGHYMGASLLASQFDALERPTDGETDVITIDAAGPFDVVLETAIAAAGFSTR